MQPLRRRRRLLVIALAILGFFAIFQIVAPFLISSSVVRESMERAVAQWTGHDVTIEGVPDIRFWPEPRITLRDITIRKPATGGERVLGRISRLSASFDLFEALIGRPEFQDFRLTNPEFYVLRDANGRLDWANDGLLSRAVREAKADGDGQALSRDADAPVGDVRITDGTLEISDLPSGNVMRFTAINGSLDWPWLSRSLEMKAAAEFNGRRLSLDLSSTQPLLLLSGKNGNASGAIQSDIIRGRFNGIANLATQGFLSGDAELTIPDLAAIMNWAGVSFAGAQRMKSLALNAHLATNDDAVRFENLSLELDGNKATGILDLMLPAGRLPRLTGTLAFNRLDLSGILDAITPPAPGKTSATDDFQAGIEFDLRLSAEEATLGPLRLSEAAVSVLDTPSQSRVDIADSDFETGRLTGRLATTKGEATDGVALHLSVRDADLGNIVKELGLSGPLPAARGSLDLALDIDRPLTAAAWRNGKGNIRLRTERGFLPGVNIGGIRQLAARKPYFPLTEAGGGNLEFDSIDISANLQGGSAEIREGRIIGGGETLTLSGVIPFASNSLALSASIQPATPAENTTPFMVFIGGSWPNPVIWPISQAPPKP
ncbi:AsmA-like C-terminal region-containing protein [Rhizobium puerariae]|uniref:AsmA-like C-terminal region-containing protein n=1 Tax=Rhizobium puerariae TaxID=1585791 RepID=A0ABV6AHY0_9HYPH